MKPTILITTGDPNGVGPEICVKACQSIISDDRFLPVLIGSKNILDKALALVGANISFKATKDISEAKLIADNSDGVFAVLETDVAFNESDLNPGKVSELAGAAALSYVHAAVELINSKDAVAMATAPINKEAIEIRVPGFQGHTEYIGEMCGDPEPVLTLVHSDQWIISHVSTHVSMREACERCKTPRILKTARLLNTFISKLRGIENPRIGVAGLNPHAGENGLFGREEIEEIAPAVELMKQEGINATGPIPGDVVFPQMKANTFDGVIAMYHDQGHVVTKTLGFKLGQNRKLNGVNVTLGLELIRTSVDHGTGFDIAWQGKADEHSLLDALNIAVRTAIV